MKRKTETRRFQTGHNDGSKGPVVIEYRTFEESSEIRADRMSADPIVGQVFETANGGAVEQIDDESYQILGTGKIVRKI
jgi:hypothetical protein